MHLSKFPAVLSEVFLDTLNTLPSFNHLNYITNVLYILLIWHRARFPDFLNHSLMLPTHFLKLTYKLLYFPLNLVKRLYICNFNGFRWTVEETRVNHIGKGAKRGF
jgi:hypothetical protein